MAEDIRTMTAELAADPGSLVFLELGETLRRRGQPEVALKVAAAGAARYPSLADAHDLLARIHSDLGDGEAAFDSWMDALQNDPAHLGAHKGLGFLYFRSGDLPRALRHLELAQSGSDDAGLARAAARVRAAMTEGGAFGSSASNSNAMSQDLPFSLDDAVGTQPAEASDPEDELFLGFEGARDGLLLLDQNGLRLGGGLRDSTSRDVSDAAAAHLSGVSREAARTARLLELGAWLSVAAECGTGNLHLSAPSEDTVLLTTRDASVPAARLAVIAERAGAAARRWLERVA
jgi:tetratricopeptide (TPR) repeat protein